MNPFTEPITLKIWEVLAMIGITGVATAIAAHFGGNAWVVLAFILTAAILALLVHWLWKRVRR